MAHRQQPQSHRINNGNNLRNPNISQNGSNDTNGSNGNGDLYQQLIDSSDLVKELDDIEAISQQISQHAEVLYQSWKQQEEASKQQQHTAGQPSYAYKQSNTLPSNSSRPSVGNMSSPPTGSLPRSAYQPGDFTKKATAPPKVQENGRANSSSAGGIPYYKQNGNHNPDESHTSMPADRRMPSSHPPTLNASPEVYSRLPLSGDQQQPQSATIGSQNQYQNIKRQTQINHATNTSNNGHTTNHLSSSASGLTSPSFISSASSASSYKPNTMPAASRSTTSSVTPTGQQIHPQYSPSTTAPPTLRSSTLPTANMNNTNTTSNNLLSENNKSNPNPKSSEQVGRTLELIATPEVNGNLKELVNSFVSTDRAKQAARQTISNTINTMSRRNGNGIRSPSPSNTASSSPFSSRGVSPLRSPMLAAASNNAGPQTVLNSLNVMPSPPSTSSSSLSSINTNFPQPPSVGLTSSGPLSPSASSTSSTASSSIDSQVNRPISNMSTDPTSKVHTKLNPMFVKTTSPSNASSKSDYHQKVMSPTTPVSPPSSSLSSWPAGQNTIPIPVQHVRTNDAGKSTSSSTLMMTGSNNKGGPLSANNLRSPRVLQNLTSSSAPSTPASDQALQPPTRQTSLEFNLATPNLPSLHDQHIGNMRHKFEEAKQRMNSLHQRIRDGAPSEQGLLSASRPPSLNMRSPFDSFSGTDPFDEIDGMPNASDDSSSHSSYLFDQFRRRVARSKRETPFAPHPELTPQQRQHIFERTSSTGSLPGVAGTSIINSVSAPNRRFHSGGSVADRVLIFERSPFALEGRSLSTGSLLDKKKEPNVPNWKSSKYEAQQKAQVHRGLGNSSANSITSSSSVSSPKIRDIPIVKADTSTGPKPLSPTILERAAPTPFIAGSTSTLSTPAVTRATSPPLSLFKPISPSAVGSIHTSTPATSLTASGLSLTAGLGSRSNSASPASTLSRVSTPHAAQPSRPASIVITGKDKVLPRFHFPYGNPMLNPYSDGNLPRFTEEFRKHKNSSVTLDELGEILKICGYAQGWKGVVFIAAGGDLNNCPSGNDSKQNDSAGNNANSVNESTTNNLNPINKGSVISLAQFTDLWRRMCQTNHDEASQFFYVVTKAADIASIISNTAESPDSTSASSNTFPSLAKNINNMNSSSFNNNINSNNSKFAAIKNQPCRKYILPEDLVILIQDVVDSHPGLGFLKEATEFHSRYVHTVIARIFYVVNRSWSGRLTLSELRRSNFLATLHLLDEEEDINAVTDYFSYEHFYVIYCKFWELDKDHDLFIDREDLARHNDHAISTRMIDRIFSGTVTRGVAQKEGKMSYTEFVWFLLAEEDKRHPTSIEYWFRCMDLDGDGYLSMYELEYFYEEQLQRMEQLGIETLPFEDCLCQMLDMIGPGKANMVSLSDLRSCPMTPIFFDTFFNLEKYLDHEQRDPFASQRDMDEDGNEMSDWDRFAAEEYELLVAEEGNADGTMDELCYEEDGDSNPEMMMEQALDNEMMYHGDPMVATSS